MTTFPILALLVGCNPIALTADTPHGPLSAERLGDTTKIVDPSGHSVYFSGPRAQGLTEWWVHRPDGVEHGFTVRAPDRDVHDHVLRLALRIDGARVDTVEVDEARLVGDDGGRWRYAGLVATDANARALPARMEADALGLALVVDVAGAVFPVEIDPLLTTTTWTAEGVTADSSYGWTAAAAGDVNGDGVSDVVIGARDYGSGSSDEGRVYVYHGTGASTTLGAATLAYDPTDDSDARFATAVAGAGDVNGDAYADILVGEPGYDGGATNEGRAWMLYGSSSGVTSVGSWSIHPTNAVNAYFGFAVAGVDIDGDGFSDVFVSAYGAENGETEEGLVYGYYGSATGPSTTDDWSAESDLADAQFGRALANGGDLDDDGYEDLVVGAPYLDVTTDEGLVYVYFGSVSGPDSTPTTLTGAVAGEGFGAAVAGVGDVDGDGVDDLLVGAPNSDAGALGGGRAALYVGVSGTGPVNVADWEIQGDTASEERGSAVAGHGDFNDDGLFDVLIGAPGWTGSALGEGAVYAYQGSTTTTLSTTAAWWSFGGQAGADLGRSVALPGDLDGDGFCEALVGVPLYDDGATDEGAVWVYPGGTDDVDGDGDLFWTDCDDEDASVYSGAAEIVDSGVDEDCDGSELCYVDADGDGHRTTGTVYSIDVDCGDAGEGRATDPADDCDDSNEDANPGEAERCDGFDNDCDGLTDPDDAVDVDTWYGDADGDGYGVSSSEEIDCDRPEGFASNNDDCDDTTGDVNPGAQETCNDRDDDCDGETDDDAVDATTWYADEDGDGAGADGEARPIEACDQPNGYVTGDTDCDDYDADVFPSANETCNGRDDDCDGEIDDSPVDAPTWYPDEDHDGYGRDEDTIVACERPSDHDDAGGDCDDRDVDVHPDAEDEEYDGVDSDCDGDEERVWVAGKTLWGCNSTGAPIGLFTILLAALALARRTRGRGVGVAIVAPFALVLASPAGAVERFDGHGFHLAPDDGDLFDLTQTWRPEQQRRFATGVTVLGEYARETVVIEQQHGDDIDTDKLRGPFGALNLGASFAVGKHLAVTVAVPAFLGSGGQAVGDMRVATPMGLWLPRTGASGGLAFVPFIDLPIGDELVFLGNRGFGGGGVFAFGGGSEAFEVNANLGAGYTPIIEFENLRGGPRLLAALGAAVRVADSTALRAEATYQPNVFVQPVDGADSPGEVLLSARGAYAIGASWTAGLAFATSPGAGASPLRLFAGGGYAFGKTALADTDDDGIADTFDACREQPETTNDYKDSDGCPDELGELEVSVTDEDGNVVPDATVAVRSTSGITNTSGVAMIPAIVPGSRALGSVTHLLYADAAFTLDSPAPGRNAIAVKVSFRRQQIHVTARDSDGRPVEARIRFEGPDDVGTRFLREDGTNSFELRPGKWRMLVSTDGLSTERRDFEVLPGQNGPIELVFDLRPATAVVDTVKREVVIREQVYFDAGQATIKAESAPIITQVANVLLDNSGIVQVEVQGHTDSDGDERTNLDLSQRRVEAVCAELMKQGVSASRLVPRGYGESLPIAPNSSPEGRAFNRRVQFSIVSMTEVPEEKPPSEHSTEEK